MEGIAYQGFDVQLGFFGADEINVRLGRRVLGNKDGTAILKGQHGQIVRADRLRVFNDSGFVKADQRTQRLDLAPDEVERQQTEFGIEK